MYNKYLDKYLDKYCCLVYYDNIYNINNKNLIIATSDLQKFNESFEQFVLWYYLNNIINKKIYVLIYKTFGEQPTIDIEIIKNKGEDCNYIDIILDKNKIDIKTDYQELLDETIGTIDVIKNILFIKKFLVSHSRQSLIDMASYNKYNINTFMKTKSNIISQIMVYKIENLVKERKYKDKLIMNFDYVSLLFNF